MDIVSIVIKNMLRSSFCLENFSCLLQLLLRNKKLHQVQRRQYPEEPCNEHTRCALDKGPKFAESLSMFLGVSYRFIQAFIDKNANTSMRRLGIYGNMI